MRETILSEYHQKTPQSSAARPAAPVQVKTETPTPNPVKTEIPTHVPMKSKTPTPSPVKTEIPPPIPVKTDIPTHVQLCNQCSANPCYGACGIIAGACGIIGRPANSPVSTNMWKSGAASSSRKGGKGRGEERNGRKGKRSAPAATTADLPSEEVGANMSQLNMPCSSKVPARSLAGRLVNPCSSLNLKDVAHWNRATRTTKGNANLFREALRTLAPQHRKMLENTRITAADALRVFKHVGAPISPGQLFTDNLWETPGNMFYSPAVYRGWVPANSGKIASVKPPWFVLPSLKGYHCCSLDCCKMINADCMRNAVNVSGTHFDHWKYFDDGQQPERITVQNNGVYFESRDKRITCCALYGALQCLPDDVLPHKPGVMVQCIFELHVDATHARSHEGQRYCLEQHVCITGLYLNLVPALRLFEKQFRAQYNVCDSFKVDFPRVAAYMQSTAFVSATG